MTAEIDRPDVVAEVRAAFERYNAAIDSRDVATLNELFWNSDKTVRFGFTENLFGYNAIEAYRGTKWSNAPQRNATNVVITTFGNDCATTMAVMDRGDRVTRQSQTWARFPEGWRIVAAHVSALKA
jgi:hypothetical protein